MADWTTDVNSEFFGNTAMTHGTNYYTTGSVADVADADQAIITTRYVSVEAAANTNPGSFLILATGKASGDDDDWATIAEISTPTTTGSTEILDNDAETGPVLEVTSTTDFVRGDWLYARDLGDETHSSWRLIKDIDTNVSITVSHALGTALQGSTDSDPLWAFAQVSAIMINVAAWQQINVLFEHVGAAGADCVVAADYALATDFV